MSELARFWQASMARFENELPQQQFNAWLSPLTPLQLDEGVLTMIAPNQIKLEWAKKNYTERIERLARDHWQNEEVRVVFALKEKKVSPLLPVTHSSLVSTDGVVIESTENLPAATELQPAASHKATKLLPQYTFDNLVEGSANNLALAAARHIAQQPNSSYTPMVIYGSSGLGKTHLLHAIGHAVVKSQPNAKLQLVSGEDFVREVVSAYQGRQFEQFKQRYHSLDVLLIDDIQFIAGKSRTQDEIFFAYEALKHAGKRIVLACDVYPTQIKDLDNRLISRFTSGLAVSIEPPEFEMRYAILLKKAGELQIQLSDEIAQFIAKHLRANVRELEGALQNLKVHCTFSSQPLTLDVARTILKDRLSFRERPLSVEDIQKQVAQFHRLTIADLLSSSRAAVIALPRQTAMYLAKEHTQLSLPEIGRRFKRDHTTVLHAYRKIHQLRITNPKFDAELKALEQILRDEAVQ